MGQLARWDRIFLCVSDLSKHTFLYVCFELFLLPDYFLSRLSAVPLQVSGGSLTGPRYPDARQCADRYGVILERQDKKPYREFDRMHSEITGFFILICIYPYLEKQRKEEVIL